MRAAAAAAAAARLCNINLRRADQKAGELSCVPAESERWREFSPLGLPGLTLDSLRAHSLRPAARRAAQDVGNATPSRGRRFHPLRSDHVSPTTTTFPNLGNNSGVPQSNNSQQQHGCDTSDVNDNGIEQRSRVNAAREVSANCLEVRFVSKQ